MPPQLARAAARQHRDEAAVAGRRRAKRARPISARKRMPEEIDATSNASIECILMRKGRDRNHQRAHAPRLLLVVEPRSGRKEIQNRPGVTKAAQRARQAEIEYAEIDEHDEIGLRCADMKGRAQHRVEQFWNARDRRQRTHARPALMVSPQTKSRRPHRFAADPFKLRLRIQAANLLRQQNRDRLAARLARRKKVSHFRPSLGRVGCYVPRRGFRRECL